MNNQKQCFYCGTGTKYKPITNKKGEIISLHSICRNPNCSVNLTMLALKRRKSTLNSKKRTVSGRRRNRLVPGLLVGIISAATSFFGFTALANSDGLKNEVSYQSPQTTISTSTTEREEPVVAKLETIKEKILRYSLKYDVNPEEIENIVKCETGSEDVNKASTTIQSRYLIGTPRRELSFGVAQIHISAHGITREQAYDVDYSLDFLASHWSKGHRGMWTNCSLKYGYL